MAQNAELASMFAGLDPPVGLGVIAPGVSDGSMPKGWREEWAGFGRVDAMTTSTAWIVVDRAPRMARIDSEHTGRQPVRQDCNDECSGR